MWPVASCGPLWGECTCPSAGRLKAWRLGSGSGIPGMWVLPVTGEHSPGKEGLQGGEADWG